MTRVVKEGYICDQTYRGSASRGLQSPFLPVPLRGTPLPPNNSPGLQSWEAMRAGRKSSKKTSSMTRPIEALPRGGLQSPFLPVPLTGAHRFFPIIAQDFSPGSTCAPAVSRQSRQGLYGGAAVEVEDLAGDEVGLGA